MDPARGAGADREVEAARQRARESRPRYEKLPDPVELPLLRDPVLEPTDDGALLADHIPDEFLYTPSESLRVWADIWHRDLGFRLSSHRPGIGRLIVWAKRLLTKLVRAPLSAELQRERIFAIVMMRRQERMLNELRRYLLEVRAPYSFLRDKAVPQLVARTDALFSILDQRGEDLEAELRRLRDEQAFRARLPTPAATASPGAASEPLVSPPLVPAPGQDDDPAYYAFEALHRGTEDEIRERQSIYLDVFRGRERVVDLGCGRGEMLELLRDAGVKAYGVDLNTSMMAQCGARGLEVVQADAVAHLRSLPDASLGGVFSAQTFEHWERERIVEAVRLIHAKLEDGAPFVMETQNPTSITVGASSFWRDLTHVRPIHPDAFEFLVQAVGFRAVEVRPLAPFPDDQRLPRVATSPELDEVALAVVDDVNRVVDAIDRRLHGHRDYAVIAHK